MSELKKFIKTNKASLVLAGITLFAGTLFVGSTAYYAYLRHTSQIKTSPDITATTDTPFMTIPAGPTLTEPTANSPTTNNRANAPASNAVSKDQLCANAITAKTSASQALVDRNSKSSVEAYNLANKSAYQTWLNSKATLGCTQYLSPPVMALAPSDPYTPPATLRAATCDTNRKSVLDSAYAQALSQEDQRFSGQVNTYAVGHGLSGSDLAQVSEIFMPQHQQNYSELRYLYFSQLASIHCS